MKHPGNKIQVERRLFAHTDALGRSFMLLVAAFMLAFAYVYQSVSITHLRFQIKDQTRAVRKLLQESDELKVMVARHSSAERIERLYRMKYGYMPVASGLRITTLTLPEDGQKTGRLRQMESESNTPKTASFRFRLLE